LYPPPHTGLPHRLFYRRISTPSYLNCISGNPDIITDDPAVAMEEAELIVFMNPAFTHFEYLRQLEPFVKPGLTVVALPGQTGKREQR
jgi:hypothetical protein